MLLRPANLVTFRGKAAGTPLKESGDELKNSAERKTLSMARGRVRMADDAELASKIRSRANLS